MNTVIVVELTGKNTSVDTIKILFFENNEQAIDYCSKNTVLEKYWKRACIAEVGKKYEMCSDEGLC